MPRICWDWCSDGYKSRRLENGLLSSPAEINASSTCDNESGSKPISAMTFMPRNWVDPQARHPVELLDASNNCSRILLLFCLTSSNCFSYKQAPQYRAWGNPSSPQHKLKPSRSTPDLRTINPRWAESARMRYRRKQPRPYGTPNFCASFCASKLMFSFLGIKKATLGSRQKTCR